MKKKFDKGAQMVIQKEIVKLSFLEEGQGLPLVIKPNVAGLDLNQWYLNNKDMVEEKILEYGGVLFRGFDTTTPESFYGFIDVSCPEPLSYKEGATPRTQVQGKVYTSTEFPNEETIAPHNELSYVMTWPKKIWFSSIVVADEGGETPIVDVRKVYNLIDPDIRDVFAEKGWMLVRNYGTGFGQTWQYVFHTESKDEVEQYCLDNNMTCQWNEDGTLTTKQVRPAITIHPDTNENLWFNHIAFWHSSSLNEEVRNLMLEEFGEGGLPYQTYYGDGSSIDADVAAHIRQAYADATIAFPWQEGDILMLDNMLVAHARNPYQGDRKVLVAMGEPVSREASISS